MDHKSYQIQKSILNRLGILEREPMLVRAPVSNYSRPFDVKYLTCASLKWAPIWKIVFQEGTNLGIT